MAIDDLAEHLTRLNPEWDRVGSRPESEPASAGKGRGGSAKGKAIGQQTRAPRGTRVLAPLLLGAGCTFGLLRAGEEKESRRRVVQLTPLGRYVLAMGPPPPARPTFDHFLFVQPNLEIIAYRQGLTPQIVGRLSRFAWWTKIGAALELRLTQESILLGLEGGQNPTQMIDILTRHSQRPLPTLVPDAIQRWSSRREQVTFYAAATLIEFASREERDQAFISWEETDPNTFVPVAERFLLVENAQQIPTDRIRTGGSRDYRHPPEKCVAIEGDGITLALDPTRSDLLIDAEIGRLADEVPSAPSAARSGSSSPLTRKYLVTPGSIARAEAMGITPAQITEWFLRRTGQPPSPAIRLLMRPSASGGTLRTRRLLVLTTPTEDLADGLLQHPATCELVGERLGPTTLVVAETNLESLASVLDELALKLVSDNT